MAANFDNKPSQFSPLVLADRLIMLAEQVDREGFREIAVALVSLADRALDYPPMPIAPFRPKSNFVDCLVGRA